MKVFMVGCATYEGECVSMGAFITEDEALDYMEEQFEHYKKESEEHYDEIDCGCHGREAFVDTGNEEMSYKWNVLSDDIKATPSAILAALRQSMWDDIDHIAQAPVPGYSSCRPAAIDLRGEQFKKLSFGNGDELVSVEAYVPMAGLAVIVKCPDGETRPGLVGPEAFDTDEILELHTIITNINHPVRAFNPFWLMDDEWHETLIDILDKTEAEYQEFISNNPKNNK